MSIGSVLAQTGANIGSTLGSGMSGLGGATRGMLTGVGQGISRRRMEGEAQKLLAANKDNPAALMEASRKFAMQGNQQMSAVFQQAAQAAQSKIDSKATAAQKRGVQGGLMAITQAASRGTPLEDLQEAQRSVIALGGTAEDIRSAYQSGLKKPEDNYKVVGNRIFDTSTGEYVEPKTVAELLPLSSLKDAVTPESLVEYAKTGDKTVLQAKEEEEVSKDIIGQLISTDTVLETVDKALGLTDDYWVAGYDLAKLIPLPTDAKQMESYVNTLKANLAFDRLQKMRDASKTGGALGQVSNIELGLLQSSVATLDPGSKNFKEQLATVRRQYENFRNSLLGQAPNDPRYIKDPDTGKLYYKLGDDYIDLEEASKTGQFNLSPSPKTGGSI